MSGYDEATGVIHLEHKSAFEVARAIAAKTDMNAVLGTAANSCFEVGSWINVIGYIRDSVSGKRTKQNVGTDISPSHVEVNVQAVLVWSAGSIQISRYEEILQRQQRSRAIK